jgi:ethanolamine permease
MNDFNVSGSTEDYSDILITRKHIHDFNKKSGLKKTLTLEHSWGIMVGLAISGLFFEWTLTLNYVEPLGMIVLIAFLSIFYALYSGMLSGLIVAYPYAGGGYAYARKAFGKYWGFLNGSLKAGEFMCFAAVILSFTDSYIKMIHLPLPDFLALALFLTLIIFQNIGIREVSLLQLVLACISISIFVMFLLGIHSVTITGLHFGTVISGEPTGLFIAIPYALWLYLGNDVTMLTVEETKNTTKTVPMNFIISLIMIFLLLLCIIMISLNSISLEQLRNGQFPLVVILMQLQPDDRVLISVFSFLSLSAFIAGLNGAITGCSRQLFALGRAGYLPSVLGRIQEKTKVPFVAVWSVLLAFPLAEFVDAILLIKIACLIALVSYIITTLSYLKIMFQHEDTFRDGLIHRIRTQLRKIAAYATLFMSAGLLLCIAVYNIPVLLAFLSLLALLSLYFLLAARKRINYDAPEEVESNTEGINIIITNLKKNESIS